MFLDRKFKHRNHKFTIFQLILGHNSRIIIEIITKFGSDMCIWSMKTKVREQKQKWDEQRDRKMINDYILNALSSYDRVIKNTQEFFR